MNNTKEHNEDCKDSAIIVQAFAFLAQNGKEDLALEALEAWGRFKSKYAKHKSSIVEPKIDVNFKIKEC